MGPTGSGNPEKYYNLANEPKKRAGEGLQSYTSAVSAVRIRNHPKYSNPIVFVDTPGFNDTNKSDIDILHTISKWLVKIYEANIRLHGIVYMHAITDPRMSGTSVHNLRMFIELCGMEAAKNVLFVTTMWDTINITDDERKREQALRGTQYWGVMLEKGASTERLDDSTSPWDVIARLLSPIKPVALQLQREMLGLDIPFKETKAAQVLESRSLITSNLEETDRIDVTGDPNFLQKDDLIILFVGPTGSGKSHIIDLISGRSEKHTSVDLQSSTQAVSATRIRRPGKDLVLVDTPGFDNTHKSDVQILELITKWLGKTYRHGFKILRIVYLHRITDNRIAETVHRSFHVFSELCGPEAAKNAVLVTTMWDEVEDGDSSVAREEEFKKSLWPGMLTRGASIARFNNTPESAWDVVAQVTRRMVDTEERDEGNEVNDAEDTGEDVGNPEKVTRRLQKEIVGEEKRIKETQAARELYAHLSIILAEQAGYTHNAVDLIQEYKRLQEQIDLVLKELRDRPTNPGRRFLLWGKNAIRKRLGHKA